MKELIVVTRVETAKLIIARLLDGRFLFIVSHEPGNTKYLEGISIYVLGGQLDRARELIKEFL